jgi:hypothetical protein
MKNVTSSVFSQLEDNGKVLLANTSGTNFYTIRSDISANFPIGAQITIIQMGAGPTMIQSVNPGVTVVNSTAANPGYPATRAQYSSATCIKLSADNWVVIGDII